MSSDEAKSSNNGFTYAVLIGVMTLFCVLLTALTVAAFFKTDQLSYDFYQELGALNNTTMEEIAAVKLQIKDSKTDIDEMDRRIQQLVSADAESKVDRTAIKQTIAQNAASDAKKHDSVVSDLRTNVKNIYVDNGWIVSGNYVFKHFAESVDYNTAGARCRDRQARLAAGVLRNADAVNYILSKSNILDNPPGRTPWIGFDDIQTDGVFKWIDGGSTNAQTTAWAPGEPTGGGEDCGQLYQKSATRVLLNDAPCSKSYEYICEIKLY